MTEETEVIGSQPPKVVFWYKLYCVSLALAYVFTFVMSFFFLLAPVGILGDMSVMEARLMGAFLLIISIPLLAACVLPLFLNPKKWVWIYGVVLIALGFGSCLYLPMSVPLIIYWMKPETRRYFGYEI